MWKVMPEIRWLEGLDEAKREARSTGKLILVFFHSRGCGGCAKTMERTFRDPDVMELINKDFAPVTLEVGDACETAREYGVEWTPTFILADDSGVELERWVGYLPEVEFLAQAHLSAGLSALHRERFKEAEDALGWIMDHQPDADAAPEARYYLGVALYKHTGDPVHLARTWEAMYRRYPGDTWTKRASAWA